MPKGRGGIVAGLALFFLAPSALLVLERDLLELLLKTTGASNEVELALVFLAAFGEALLTSLLSSFLEVIGGPGLEFFGVRFDLPALVRLMRLKNAFRRSCQFA